jgi:hypothetical protein
MIFCVVFCRSVFVLLSFFDIVLPILRLRILITPLVSSNFSLNQLMGSQLSPLDKWVSNGNTYMLYMFQAMTSYVVVFCSVFS